MIVCIVNGGATAGQAGLLAMAFWFFEVNCFILGVNDLKCVFNLQFYLFHDPFRTGKNILTTQSIIDIWKISY
jgi:hypothetical protein